MCLALGVVMTNAGCPQATPPQDGEPGVVEVRIQVMAFVPAEVTITQGETVRWVNSDLVQHTATSGNPGDADAGAIWDSGFLGRGASFEHTFGEVGEFTYFCQLHPTTMRDARVIVQAQ